MYNYRSVRTIDERYSRVNYTIIHLIVGLRVHNERRSYNRSNTWWSRILRTITRAAVKVIDIVTIEIISLNVSIH